MDSLFGNIYCLFESLFGQSLAEYLWGYNCNSQIYDNPNIFNRTGLFCIVTVSIINLIYYYVFNPVRSKYLWWSIALLLSGFVNLFIGYGITITNLNNEKIGDCLKYQFDTEGNISSMLIDSSNCWMFGISNFIIACVLFFLFSCLSKWGSKGNKYIPF